MIEKVNLPEKYLGKYEVDDEGFIRFGDIVSGLMGRQTQYVSRLIDGTDSEYPNFGELLRFKKVFMNGKGTGNYHDYMIHKDDIDEFIKRARKYYGS